MTARSFARTVAIALGVLLGLLFADYARPLARSNIYQGRAFLKNANEGVIETDIAYLDVLIGNPAAGRSYGVVLAGDRDHPLIIWLEGVRERGHRITILLEEIEP